MKMNQKQTIVITGTSSGIGRATAELFSKRGWHVAATMRKPESEASLKSNNESYPYVEAL